MSQDSVHLDPLDVDNYAGATYEQLSDRQAEDDSDKKKDRRSIAAIGLREAVHWGMAAPVSNFQDSPDFTNHSRHKKLCL